LLGNSTGRHRIGGAKGWRKAEDIQEGGIRLLRKTIYTEPGKTWPKFYYTLEKRLVESKHRENQVNVPESSSDGRIKPSYKKYFENVAEFKYIWYRQEQIVLL
jgi:hypothetical protein